MRYSFLFVAALILVSGFIAYFGDLLGRWMGKKRLTLGRLRPRHTAYLVTALTGMLISAMALTALVSVNSQFKRVLTEGEQIIAQNETLSKTNAGLLAKNRSLERRREELQARVARQRKEVDAAEEAAVNAAEAQVRAEKTVARLEKDIAARKGQIENLTHASAAARRELVAQTDRLNGLEARLRTAQSAVARAQSNVARALDRQGKAQSELAETYHQLEAAEKQLENQRSTLAEQQRQIEAQQAELVKKESEKQKFERQASELLGGDICIRQGDEIVRGTIPAGQSMFGIKGDLFSLLDAASRNAAKLGAGEGPNGRAVTVIYQQALTEETAVRIDDENTCVTMAADAIARSALRGWDALVQVVCGANTLAGEQVPVKLVLYYNTLVYRKGDKIASTRMNGRASEGRVLLSVINFLQDEVSRSALRAGIIPVANPDPRASLASDPRTQVEGLMSVVDQITSKNARVNVDAYACADIYAIGPLNMTNMRFSVTKIE